MASILTPNLKMIRAKHHLDALDVAVREFRATPEKHQRVTTYDDPASGHFVVRCQALNEDDTFGFGLIAGDFVCNLRAALDQLAWQLALLGAEKPSRNICFPVSGENTLDTQLKITKSTFGIPEAAIAIMKSLQPYHRGDAHTFHHLWRLQFLWNTDKHRNLVLGGTMGGEVVKVPRDVATRVVFKNLDDGAEVRIPLADKHRIIDLNPHASVDIMFGNRDEGVTLFLEDLSEMYKFVTAEVIPRFESFFS